METQLDIGGTIYTLRAFRVRHQWCGEWTHDKTGRSGVVDRAASPEEALELAGSAARATHGLIQAGTPLAD